MGKTPRINTESALDNIIREDDKKLAREWTVKIEAAGAEPRAYLARKKVIRELLKWGIEDPQLRQDIVADVLRSTSGKYTFEVLAILEEIQRDMGN